MFVVVDPGIPKLNCLGSVAGATGPDPFLFTAGVSLSYSLSKTEHVTKDKLLLESLTVT